MPGRHLGGVRAAVSLQPCAGKDAPAQRLRPRSKSRQRTDILSSTGSPSAVAAANLTSPPPIRPRECRNTSAASNTNAAAADAAAPGKLTSNRPARPSSATAMATPSGIVRVAISTNAANINKPTIAVAKKSADHTMVPLPRLQPYTASGGHGPRPPGKSAELPLAAGRL